MIEAPSNSSDVSRTDISWQSIDKVKFNIYGAGLFTAISVTLYPTNVVKTRMQLAKKEYGHLNALGVSREIWKKDGIRGLYRGLGTTVTASIPVKAMYFTTLEISKESCNRYLSSVNLTDATKNTVSSCIAGLISSLLAQLYYVPLDVVTQRLMGQELPGVPVYSGGIDAFQKILRTDGIAGLYRGLAMSFITHCPLNTVMWGTYEMSQHAIWKSLGYTKSDDGQTRSGDGQYPSKALLVSAQAFGSVVAGAASAIITTPLDTIKTRLQSIEGERGHKPNIRGTVKQLMNEDGWKGFYRGFGPRFVGMFMFATPTIVSLEFLKRLSVQV